MLHTVGLKPGQDSSPDCAYCRTQARMLHTVGLKPGQDSSPDVAYCRTQARMLHTVGLKPGQDSSPDCAYCRTQARTGLKPRCCIGLKPGLSIGLKPGQHLNPGLGPLWAWVPFGLRYLDSSPVCMSDLSLHKTQAHIYSARRLADPSPSGLAPRA